MTISRSSDAIIAQNMSSVTPLEDSDDEEEGGEEEEEEEEEEGGEDILLAPPRQQAAAASAATQAARITQSATQMPMRASSLAKRAAGGTHPGGAPPIAPLLLSNLSAAREPESPEKADCSAGDEEPRDVTCFAACPMLCAMEKK